VKLHAAAKLRRVRQTHMLFILAIATVFVDGLRPHQSPPSASQSLECAVDTIWRWAEPSAATTARLVPEYAGNYATPQSLTVFLTDNAANERLRSALATSLTSDWGKNVLRQTRFVVVRYSYRQLQSWLECGVAQAPDGTVEWSFLDFRANRASFGVVDSAAQKSIEQLLISLRVPRDAFQVQIGGLPNEEL
jgi:hypothetical protein